jgi:hypothetical protein
MTPTQTQSIPPHLLMKHMVCAPWLTQSIYVAAELGIADLVDVWSLTLSVKFSGNAASKKPLTRPDKSGHPPPWGEGGDHAKLESRVRGNGLSV